ncbi:MAG: glycoside hydrolase family 57 protein [Desulfuromonadaceae bacterium]|nr:glycoside hydrolase family 57 protein [Desulfuromonas sp.]MDY0184523.1 glycoside hydrolase family 57 protein [Desulfuromonadaceae bacterium]
MTDKINVVLCWHMHQPHYRDALDGTYHLPWVYLHAIKDYSDMAYHLETCPEARVVVNFAPVLLEQLNDYAAQMRKWLRDGEATCDPLLNLVAGATPISSVPDERADIISACQRAYAPTMIERYPAFRTLVNIAKGLYFNGDLDVVRVGYLSSQFFTDLLMWYHLAWLGSSIKKNDFRVSRLMARKSNFTSVDQSLLIEVLAETVESIIPRYRILMESGRIELAMSPYGHPIVPLLLDFSSMHESQPSAPMPLHSLYPGGQERVDWHMQRGFELFEEHFGIRPAGVWLSEGAISSAAIDTLDKWNVGWTASGEGVWRNSCDASSGGKKLLDHKNGLYAPVQHTGNNCAVFFRDDGLSDLIGFEYKNWHPADAAADFCGHLHNIAKYFGPKASERVISIVLDGENAWEYYPDNGYTFLQTLYQKLSTDPKLNMTTYSAVLNGEKPCTKVELDTIKAGSWVFGTFSTWIGEGDKNAAWDMLVEAKNCFDRSVQTAQLSEDKLNEAMNQLAVCEGSDWFWWFGDLNPAESVRDFDQLFRRHLIRLYQLLEKVPPKALKNPISRGGGNVENSGTMRRN